MAGDTEFLFADESDGSENLKLVRMARTVRQMRIGSPKAHCAIVGLLSTELLLKTTDEMEAERGKMKDALWRVRTKLTQFGLGDDALRVYVPFKCVPVQRPGQVVLYARDAAAPRANPYLWDRQPAIQAVPTPDIEASMVMEYDLQARDKEEKAKGNNDSLITCQVQVAIWDAKTNTKSIQFLPDASVSLKIGPGGIEEVTAEMTAVKLKLKGLNLADKYKWGTISKVEIAFKGEAGVGFKSEVGKDQASRLLTEWQAKVKLQFSADLQIPKTGIKIPIEISGYVDQAGKPGVGLTITIVEF